jgi:hypothetical protein
VSTLTTEDWLTLAWGSPFGLGFLLIALGVFLLALGKFLTYIADAIQTLRRPPEAGGTGDRRPGPREDE